MQTQGIAIAAAVAGIVALTAVDGWTQSGAGVLSHTPWGHPDLQGIWNNSTTTPLEQLTDEERAQDRVARRPVIAATRGTGAAWPEQKGRLDQQHRDDTYVHYDNAIWLATRVPKGLSSRRTSLITDPPDGRMSMTAEAVQRLIERENARADRGESDSWLDRNSWERCLTRTLPVAMIPNLYNANYQILQTPDHVVLVMEMIHEARIIPLGGGSRASGRIRQWLGDSRGYWDGEPLVVETLHFNSRLDGGDYQPSHIIQTGHRGSGESLRLVERFTRVDADTIDYRFTVEDQTTYTRPYTAAIPMNRSAADVTLFEYACHEGNYGMANLLRAGRSDEQQALDLAALVSQQRKDAGHPGVREPAVPFAPLAGR